MKTKKPAGPSPDEVAAQRAAMEESAALNREQRLLLEQQRADIATAKEKAEKDKKDSDAAAARAEAARAGGRSGMRALLSGDWTGYRRGGDLGGR